MQNISTTLFFLFTILGRAVKQEKDEDKEEEPPKESTSKAEARSKLNQALENVEEVLEKEKEKELQEDSSESEVEEEKVPAKKSKVKTEKEDSPVVKTQKPAKQTQQASYIMKLFDRSVNLAKFTEETPLYPLCRSWMLNAPRQLTSVKAETTSESTSQTTEEGDVLLMPKIRIRKGGKPLVQRKEVKLDKSELDKSIDSEVWTKEKLLEFHRGRWEGERQKQIENSRKFEEKHFAANLELLESLFKGNEE